MNSYYSAKFAIAPSISKLQAQRHFYNLLGLVNSSECQASLLEDPAQAG